MSTNTTKKKTVKKKPVNKAAKKTAKKTVKKVTKKANKKAMAKQSSGPKFKGENGKCIRIRGAKEHNLKSMDIDIPRDQLVIITGLSGSGKSSLAFDTIFAEGQRKYME